MASTYSDLKIELIGTGEQSGTWGNTTNTNLGTAVEDAITGSATVTFSSADVTLTLTNTNASQTARNLRLVLSGTSGGARQLILGSGCQINKLYLIQNDLADAVTVKNTTGTGVTVPAGKKQFVFNNGTNVVEATTATVNLASDVTGTLPIANGGTGSTSTTYCNLATNVTGTLPIANGGTGATSLTANNVLLGNNTSALQVVAPGSSGNVLTSNGSTWTSAAPSGGGGGTVFQTVYYSSAFGDVTSSNIFSDAYSWLNAAGSSSSLTITIPADRASSRLLVWLSGPHFLFGDFSGTANAEIRIRRSTTVIQLATFTLQIGGGVDRFLTTPISIFTIITPGAGTHTFDVMFRASSANALISTVNSNPAFFVLQEVAP